jgi:hypothetical protein
LHRWKFDRGLGELADLLLHELETAELESKPVESERALTAVGQAHALEGIEAAGDGLPKLSAKGPGAEKRRLRR